MNEGKVSAALVKAVTGDRSKLPVTNRMIPFLTSPLVTLQNKLVILQEAAGERSLYNLNHLARGHSEEQAREAFERAETLFSNTYEQLLQQPAGTFHPGQPGRHKEQAELPRHYGGYNKPTLRNLPVHEPARAGAMVGIIGLIGQCELLGAEERDPQQWYKCTSARLRA